MSGENSRYKNKLQRWYRSRGFWYIRKNLRMRFPKHPIRWEPWYMDRYMTAGGIRRLLIYVASRAALHHTLDSSGHRGCLGCSLWSSTLTQSVIWAFTHCSSCWFGYRVWKYPRENVIGFIFVFLSWCVSSAILNTAAPYNSHQLIWSKAWSRRDTHYYNTVAFFKNLYKSSLCSINHISHWIWLNQGTIALKTWRTAL